jgi:hypothetical protein
MSKKITESMLKALVEEVLNEEQQLDEKKVKGFSLTDLANEKDKANPKFYKKSKMTGGYSKELDAAAFRNIDTAQQVAGLDGDPTALDLDDLEHPSVNSKYASAWKKAINNPITRSNVKTFNVGGNPPAQTKTQQRNTLSKKLTTDLASLKAQYGANPTGNYTTLETQIQNDLDTLVALYKAANPASSTKYGKLKIAFQEYLSNKGTPSAETILDKIAAIATSNLQADKTDMTLPAGAHGTPRGLYGDMSVAGQQTQMGISTSSDLDDAATRAATAAAGRITIPMNELLKAQVMRRQTDNNFKVTGTEITTMKGIADEFAKVAEAMNPANFNMLDKLSVDESIMLMTKISFVSSLFGIGKELPQGQEAGYVWEKMSALFMGGFVGGKTGEATDVMSNLFGSSSQKFTASGITQANSNIVNALRAKKRGESLYYLALRKSGGSAAAGFDKIYFVLLRLKAIADNTSSFDLHYYTKGGKFKSLPDKANVQVHLRLTKAEVNAILTDVPVLDPKIPADLKFTEAIDALSNNLSGRGGGSFGELSRTTIAIAKKLSEMQNVTNEYRNAKAADAASGFSSGNAASDYTDKISDTYLSIKTDYKSLFMKLSDYTGKAATTFQEGKKVTADLLKKLISETFKK